MEKFREKSYTVWVGGTEVNDVLLTKKEAEKIVDHYIKNGYDDAVLDRYTETEINNFNRE